MTTVHFVKAARKDNDVCRRGESYYWWKFRYGGKHYSVTRPRPSQLTQSAFLSSCLAVAEEFEDCESVEDLRSSVESACDTLDSLRDETEEHAGNMPDSLREGPTGELLQTRAEQLDEWINNLRALDTESWDDDDLDTAMDEVTACDPGIEQAVLPPGTETLPSWQGRRRRRRP